LRNPRTKYKRSKNVFSVTSMALSCGHIWARLLEFSAQSLIGSPGTLSGSRNLPPRTPTQTTSDGRKSTSAPIQVTPLRPLTCDSAPLGVNDTAVTRGEMKSTVGEGEDRSARTHPLAKNSRKKSEGENSLGQGTKSPHGKPHTRLDF